MLDEAYPIYGPSKAALLYLMWQAFHWYLPLSLPKVPVQKPIKIEAIDSKHWRDTILDARAYFKMQRKNCINRKETKAKMTSRDTSSSENNCLSSLSLLIPSKNQPYKLPSDSSTMSTMKIGDSPYTTMRVRVDDE